MKLIHYRRNCSENILPCILTDRDQETKNNWTLNCSDDDLAHGRRLAII